MTPTTLPPASKDAIPRRRFLMLCAAAAGMPLISRSQPRLRGELVGQVGITSSTLAHQMKAGSTGKLLDLWDLPNFLRDELDMSVLDINSNTLGSREPRRLERFRKIADEAGCVITNLKVNDVNLPFDHADPSIRRPALEEYKQWIIAAERLGARWLRPMPAVNAPKFPILVESYRELADFADDHGITLLIENYRWIEPDPLVIPRLIEALGRRIAASADLANWHPTVRYEGLTRAFPYAVTCDFKTRGLTAAGKHPAYDLHRCFEIGWEGGFRGPWCIEHINRDSSVIVEQLRWLKGRLDSWIQSADA